MNPTVIPVGKQWNLENLRNSLKFKHIVKLWLRVEKRGVKNDTASPPDRIWKFPENKQTKNKLKGNGM